MLAWLVWWLREQRSRWDVSLTTAYDRVDVGVACRCFFAKLHLAFNLANPKGKKKLKCSCRNYKLEQTNVSTDRQLSCLALCEVNSQLHILPFNHWLSNGGLIFTKRAFDMTCMIWRIVSFWGRWWCFGISSAGIGTKLSPTLSHSMPIRPFSSPLGSMHDWTNTQRLLNS